MAAAVVAVTGGVASGKSATTDLFAARGIVVVDADLVARAAVEPGQPALAEVAARFGADCLGADGRLDRAAMRARVFADPSSRRELEAILHPRIRQQMHAACLQAPGSYVIAAIPLLAEGGGRSAWPWLRRILVVDVPEAVQLRRLMQRDGVDAALAERMVAAQASRTQRLAIADDVLVNDGSPADLQGGVERLDARYRRLA